MQFKSMKEINKIINDNHHDQLKLCVQDWFGERRRRRHRRMKPFPMNGFILDGRQDVFVVVVVVVVVDMLT